MTRAVLSHLLYITGCLCFLVGTIISLIGVMKK